MRIDHVALIPVYAAAATAVLALIADLIAPGRRGPVLTVAAAGALAVAFTAFWFGYATTPRGGVCGPAGCSFVLDSRAALVASLFALLTLGVLALSTPLLRQRAAPPGEYTFLLACSMTGGVVLGGSRDLVTLIVALETLTLPLYVLVGLRRRVVASAEGALTFFVASVVATSVALLGAALLYASTGALHFAGLRTAPVVPQLAALHSVGAVLLLVGLSFKIAAVPLHAWAPATYDGAPVPIAAYLSTASKLGGVIAIVLVAGSALPPRTAAATLAVLATLTMTVGNAVALRQRRMVRLLAWSSIAQAGYIIAPLAALPTAPGTATTATIAYTVFYVLLELGAFSAVVALRGAGDGGPISGYAGVARRAPWPAAVFALALAGLAGLPPGLAGLFAKVGVVRALLDGGVGWLAAVVAINAVVGLAYYVRVAALLYTAPPEPTPAPGSAAVPAPGLESTPAPGSAAVPAPGLEPSPAPGPAAAARSRARQRRVPRISWPVTAVLTATSAFAIVAGFAPQLVLALAAAAR